MIADEAVAELVSVTGAAPEEARSFLEMAGGDLQQAVTLYFDMGGSGGGGQAAPMARQQQPDAMDEDVAAEVAAVAAAAGIDPSEMTGHPQAEQVRAPIASFEDQIINPEYERRREQAAIQADKAAMQKRMSFDRDADVAGAGAGDSAGQASDAPTKLKSSEAINQLFAPPSYNEPGPFYDTIAKAAAEKKWVLVNIQQAEVFASHTLNRDVWRDETIQDTVEGSFLFWQRDDKSTEGEQFCQYYQCGHQLPHICVVDPRTKRRVKCWDGRKWTESHAAAEYLFGFLDQFSMDVSPPSGSPLASPSMGPRDEPMGVTDDVRLVGFDEALSADRGSGGDAHMAPAEPEPPREAPAEMPEEPPADAQHLKVSFRLPTGKTERRRFLPADPVERMFQVASALAGAPLRLVDLSTNFPKRSLRDIAGGLDCLVKDAEVAGSQVMVTLRAA